MSPASASNFSLIASSFKAAVRPGRIAMISTSDPWGIIGATSGAMDLEGAMIVSSTFASSSCTPGTCGKSLSTIGARMKIALKGLQAALPSLPFDCFKNSRSRSAWKLSVCRPKWLRLTRTSRPPMSSWPPFLVRFADSASNIRPAQVPQVGFLETLSSY